MQKVIVLLPTYNEKEIIGTTIAEVLKNITLIANFDIHILVVDSNSPDGTGQIVEDIKQTENRVNLLVVKERGLGLGLVKGYEYAFNDLRAEIVLQMDADMQHNPKDINKLLSPFLEGYEFVQGSRFIRGGGNNLEPHRKFLSWAANLTARILFGAYHTHEFTTSFRAFTRNVWRCLDFSRIPHRGKSFIFQPAFLYAVIKQGIRIKEVPIVFTDRKKGYSKMDMLQYSFELMRYGIKERLKKHAKFIKFCIVGSSGAFMQSVIYGVLKSMIDPAVSIMIGAELAIINGFYWNNRWTYGDRKIIGNKMRKFVQYNAGSLGSLLIQGVTVKTGTLFFGRSQPIDWFFACLGIGIGLIWNFIFYSKVVWKK